MTMRLAPPLAALRICTLLCLGLTAACSTREAPPAAPAGQAVAAPTLADANYELLADESWLRILVYRDGTLAALGHNHVLSTTALSGELALREPVADSAVSLQFPVASLEVDRPELRAAEGEDFPGEIEQSAIDGTRDNLLGEKVLDAARYPLIRIRSLGVSGQLPALEIRAEMLVRDQWTPITVPVDVRIADEGLEATGELSIRQTELGLEPFSVAFGALSVRDELGLKFFLVAAPRP